MEKYFKRNEQELLENIQKLEQKKLIPIKDPEDESITEPKKDKKDKINLPYNIKQLYIYMEIISQIIIITNQRKN